MFRPRPTRSQDDFIFDFDEDSDTRYQKDDEVTAAAASSADFTVTVKKTITIPSPWSFKAKDGITRKSDGSLLDQTAASLPVNVTDWSGILQHGRRERAEEENDYEYKRDQKDGGKDEDDEEDDTRVPPHEYLARRRGASFSVHEGVGRTLKGRDLRRVRNAIWKQVGFED